MSIRGSVELIPNGEPGYTPLKERYLARFPASAPTFQLADFNFWRITPTGGRYVAGLSKAYNITLEALKKLPRAETIHPARYWSERWQVP